MIRRAVIFLKAIRVIESILMTGFPLIGFILALSPGSFENFPQLIGTAALFCFATFFLVIYVYTFNSWGGIEADKLNARLEYHPVLTGDMSEGQLRAITYAGIVINLILFYFLFPRCFLLAPFIAINWTLYSHPKVMGKALPIAGTSIHFVGGVLQLLLGYVVIKDFSLHGIMGSVYFALIFAAGHLNHEVKDYDADLEANLRTNAVIFGPKRMLRVAFFLFTVAFIYLLTITLIGVLTIKETWPFLATYPIHLFFHVKMKLNLGKKTFDRGYQRNYRLLFVIAGVILLITKLMETFYLNG